MRYFFALAALLVASQLVAQQATQPAPARPTDPAINSTTPGAQNDVNRPRTQQGMDNRAQHAIRASKIIGVNVKNKANEDIGSINDLVIDPADGRVAYAAISMGGFLGVGDKLFAVPWDAIQWRQENNEHVAYLDVNKQTMENAQGFDQNNWPDMANPRWRTENDQRYQSLRPRRHETYRPIQQPGASTQPSNQQPSAQPLPTQQTRPQQ